MATLTGIDVSKWQGAVDFAAVAREGHRFAFIRSSYGADEVDPRFAENWAAAKAAGLFRGAYHFAYMGPPVSTDARVEAEHMVRTVGKLGPGDLPPVLDVEWGGAKTLNHPKVLEWTLGFLRRVEELLGRTPIVYTGPNFWRFKLGSTSELNGYPLWVVDYTTRPQPKPMGDWRWTFWQHSCTGKVAGIKGNVDLNRFAGSEAELLALAGLSGGATSAPPTPGELASGRTPTFESLPTVDLATREPSEAVERVQALLLAHGYGPAGLVDPQTGAPDGDPGPKTRAALLQFKRAYGIDSSATLVDAKTWWLLLGAGLEPR